MAKIETSGLYIHIPFCKQKCLYCDFVSVTNYDKNLHKAYIDALMKELVLRKQAFKDRTVETIYIGGGTPSVVDISLYENLFKKLFSVLDKDKIKEITFEANPESVSQETASFLLSLPNARVSLGVQTTNDEILQTIGRIAHKKDIDNALTLLSQIDNISVDLILGLPKSGADTTSRDINYITERTNINHISVYFLEIDGKERLKKKWKDFLPSEDPLIKSYFHTLDVLYSKGFERYEISNFSRGEKFRSKHNMRYWNMDEYAAVGVSASGFYNAVRYTNTHDIKKYFSLLDNKTLPIDFAENITDDIYKKEYIFLALRKKDGINLMKYKEKFGENFISKFESVIKKYEVYFDIDKTKISFRDEGMLYSNEIVSSLFIYM